MRISRQLLIANQHMLFEGEFERNWISETSLYSLRFIQQYNVYGVMNLAAKKHSVLFFEFKYEVNGERERERERERDRSFVIRTRITNFPSLPYCIGVKFDYFPYRCGYL